MTAEIIVVGNELLDGSRRDEHTAYLAAQMAAVGVTVERSILVPDDPAIIEATMLRALEAADLVVTTGGLGVTSDDLTKQVAARVCGRRLALDERALSRVRERFEERGLAMPEINVSQAMVPEGARVIENRHGTAPGLLIEHGEALLFLLPGVGTEMRAMVEGYVVPFLEGRGLRRLTEERLIRTTGLSESRVAEIVGPLARRIARTEIAYLPSRSGVDLKVVSRIGATEDAGRAADEAAERIAEALGPFVYARGPEALEEIVGYLLSMARLRLAVAESCTAGRIGWRITRVPGSSAYFAGGVIAYSDDVKRRALGVRAETLASHGAVSEETAREMAAGACAAAGADVGLAVTGIAGPDGGSSEKPVGLVHIAVAGRFERAQRHLFAGGRDAVREQAAQAALELLRRALLNIEGT
ncbi:MAG: competence/damage-inducible protein A [Candidatus Eisenbacteria bacterium]|nr:competence/damage-inducible protein A [Candidatus Eisenbacteria bacterium]